MKGATANPPRTSVSPGTIRKYMVHDSGKESPGKQMGTKSKTPECLSKIGTRRQLAEIDIHTASSKTIEEVTMEPQQKKTASNKG